MNATNTQSAAAPRRHRGRPPKAMATAAIAPDIFDTVPMMRLSARYGTKGMAAAMVVICTISQAGYCLEWTEREKWSTLRRLPGMEAEELDEVVRAMAVVGLLDESTYIRHGVLTSHDIQRAYFATHRRTAALPYILGTEAPTPRANADAPHAVAAPRTAAGGELTASITAYTAEGLVYYGSKTIYAENAQLRAQLRAENAQLRAQLRAENAQLRAQLRAENAQLCTENAHFSQKNDCKETETKKETDKETTPAPPKETEKEINKEKETADVVPTSVSCRAEADDDAAQGMASRRAREGRGKGSAAHAENPVDYSMLRRAWNDLMQGREIPRLRAEISGQRRRMLGARLREHGKDTVWLVMRKAAASSYMNGGGSKGWVATFDWLMRPTNFQKVLDGHYDDSRTMRMRRRAVLGAAYGEGRG